jgi:arginase
MTIVSARLLEVPYHLGRRGVDVGAGPERLAAMVPQPGDRQRIEIDSAPASEIEGSFAVLRATATAVANVKRAGAVPLVFAGNCMTAVAACANPTTPRLGVVWLDAHGDFHTPETTHSGYLDGMALAMLTDACWYTLLRAVPGFTPISAEQVLFVGGHALDVGEGARMRAAGITVIGGASLKRVEAAIETLASRADALYVHCDLDVLDTGELTANTWARPGGMSSAALLEVLAAITARSRIEALAFTAYDPSCDERGSGPGIVERALAATLTRAA